MNSVMDDNRILTLTNGERIRLEKHCAMLFEVFDLQYASPATISRCGMVYVDPKNLGYKPFYERWARMKQETHNSDTIYQSLKELFDKYIPQLIDRIYEGIENEEIVAPIEFISPRTNLNIVQQLCNIVDSLLPDENPPEEFDQLEKIFIFSLVWSAGGCLLDYERDKFDAFLKNITGILNPPQSYYDVGINLANYNNIQWSIWSSQLEKYEPPKNGKFSKILVPTVDTK